MLKNDTSTGRVSIQLSLALRATNAGLYSKFSSSSSSLPQNISFAFCPLWRFVGAFQSPNRVISADSTRNYGSEEGGGHHLSPKIRFGRQRFDDKHNTIGKYEAQNKAELPKIAIRMEIGTTVALAVAYDNESTNTSSLTPNLELLNFSLTRPLGPLLATRSYFLIFQSVELFLHFFFHSLFCQF